MHVAILLTISLLATACEGSIKATAPNVASPVLLGPIDRVGGHRAPEVQPSGTFSAILQQTISAVIVPIVGVGTMFASLGNDSKNLSYAAQRATAGDASQDAHVDDLRVGASCAFLLLFAGCNQDAVVRGHATVHASADSQPSDDVEDDAP
jgi:hypothetical protein